MKLLTKVHLLYCSCYVKQQYVDDDDNESLSLCVNTSRSKIVLVVNDCFVPPSWRMAVGEGKILFSGSTTGSQPFPCDASLFVQYWWWWDWAPDGLQSRWARSALHENRAQPPSTSMQKRNISCSTCGSRVRPLWGEGSKAIKCKTRAEQSKCLSASVRDIRISVNRERKLKAVSTYRKAL